MSNLPDERRVYIAGRIAGLEEAAELCRIYRDAWNDSILAAPTIRSAHIDAAGRLKMLMNKQVGKIRRENE